MTEPAVIVVRHGETAWSRSGQHTSRTELDLTPEGERQAAGIGAALAGTPTSTWSCAARACRARRTAELAGLEPIQIEDDLAEWDYGDFEGLTTTEIQERYPGWSVWDGPWPGGETAAEVVARADRVIDALLRLGRHPDRRGRPRALQPGTGGALAGPGPGAGQPAAARHRHLERAGLVQGAQGAGPLECGDGAGFAGSPGAGLV